ncbi:hypothetical protein R6Q57_025274 [Mikania cordata]
MEKEKEKEEMKRQVWDCGSSLYDSFELKSLQNHLNSAISARTMSMPHLSDCRQPPPTARKTQGSHAHSTGFSGQYSGSRKATISPQQTEVSTSMIRPVRHLQFPKCRTCCRSLMGSRRR